MEYVNLGSTGLKVLEICGRSQIPANTRGSDNAGWRQAHHST